MVARNQESVFPTVQGQNRVITAQNGIPLTISTTTYSWTYGPTAMLIVILSLWRRYDYCAKAVQPWCELQAGKATASRSVLLDYITPFQAMSLLRAIKNRHFVVASTIASFFIIKLIILTSTTLFAPIRSTTLGNLSDLAFAEMLWANFKKPADSLVTSDKIPTRRPARTGLTNSPLAPEAVLFQLMYAQLGYPEDLDIFNSPSVLANSSITILEAVARNMARQSLLVPSEEQAIARGFRTESRLFMRPVAIWTIVGMFTLLTIICLLLLCITRPFEWSPTMAGSLASHASVLVNSPDFQKVLAETGHLPQDGLKESLNNIKFSTVTGRDGEPRLTVETARQDSGSEELSSKTREQKRPWIPLAVRLPLISITFIAPLICIGVLELLYRILRDKKHLVVIGTQDSDALSYVIRLASTIIVFGVATMINNLDFTILTFAPYSNLRAGSASAKRSLLFHPLSMNPFLILFKAALNGQIGIASSNAATIIAGFLTIIVSGLWIAVQSPVVNQHASALVRNWDLDWFSDYGQDNGATLELNLIRNRGAVTPPSIWNELVVPKISLQGDFTDAAYRDPNYVFDVIALQPIINCSVLPQEAISSLHWSFADQPGAISNYAPPDGAMVAISPPRIPQTCSVSNHQGFADLRINITYNTYDSLSKVWVAKYIDLANSTAGQVEVDCPSIAMFFGYFNKTEPSEKNITALLCTQGINQVPVSIQYRGDPILGQITSVRKRGKSEPVRNRTTGSETLGYKLEPFMASQLLNFEKNDTEYQYDPFFDQLLHHSNRYPTDSLLGPSNTDSLIEAVTNAYCELMRHIINRNLRFESDKSRHILGASEQASTTAQSVITGYYSAEVTHLVIDSTSKLILQILLGAMTGLSFIGFLLVKIRRTLPRDPCTIGSTMSLLAGSELCDPRFQVLPSGAERMSVKEMTLALDGWVFSLGWWRSTTANDTSCPEVDSSTSHVDLSARNATETDEKKMRFGINIGKPDSSVLS
ncbi:hypothetical protein EDB82DRAFT_553592 [Fusarium venenatum]|uniref:uncharacterized protein n=1 Tax=Fusarium venenatum TaxID=56646 RepID=UPI001D77A509|nr:hypothetical protein EDB82DRAFT_553592 [Fusarium venenatum]